MRLTNNQFQLQPVFSLFEREREKRLGAAHGLPKATKIFKNTFHCPVSSVRFRVIDELCRELCFMPSSFLGLVGNMHVQSVFKI
jgi:hypothetical protein